jgi:hypothetical protein
MVRQEEAPRFQIFSGWKEIAGYLHKGVRTVQRYERELGLPIHRPSGKSSAAVVAIQPELDKWLSAGPSRRNSIPRRRVLNAKTNKLRANFLQIDSEIAVTFANIALHTDDPQKRRRTANVARKAYDTITRFSQNTDLSDLQKNKLVANLRRLRHELQILGCRV